MLVLKPVIELFTKDWFQRAVYSVLFALLTWLYWDVLISGETTEYNVSYRFIYMIPASIFGIQILRNNRVIWVLIISAFTLLLLMLTYASIDTLLNPHGGLIAHISSNWDLFLVWFGVLLTLLFFYLLRPDRII